MGLGLEASDQKKPDWARVISEMFVGGFLVWGLFIFQLEWFMTPPRSELWAGCLGAAFALAWYLYRSGFKNALRVAGYSAVGAGFGFSFGNFIQGIGSVSGVAYNWWNVMEFTLGLCGGAGMAYGIAKSTWPQQVKISKKSNWFALLFVFLFIPFINYAEAFNVSRITGLAESLSISGISGFVATQKILAGIILILFVSLAIFIWKRFESLNQASGSLLIPLLFISNTMYYLLFSYLRKGMFYKSISLKYSDTLYLPILISVFLLWYFNRKKDTDISQSEYISESWKRWGLIICGLLILIVLITSISISIHDGMQGSHERF